MMGNKKLLQGNMNFVLPISMGKLIKTVLISKMWNSYMHQNPFPKKARKLLHRPQLSYQFLEWGSYLSAWRRRNALKMWTGWPSVSMKFVKGVLVGGASDLRKLIDNGELARLLSGKA